MSASRAKQFVVPCLFVLWCAKASAQNFLGVAFSDYNTYPALFNNPAAVAGCKEQIVLNVVALDAMEDDNSSFQQMTGKSKTGNTEQTIYRKAYPVNTNVTGIPQNMRLLPPGILVRIDMNNTFAITTRFRSVVQYNNLNSDFINAMQGRSENPSTHYSVENSKFSAIMHNWGEIGITYGFNLINGLYNQLKLGVSLKYLSGGNYVALSGDKLTVDYDSAKGQYKIAASDLLFATNMLQSSENEYITFSAGAQAPSRGRAMDIGFVYTHIFNAGSDNAFDVNDYNAPDGNRLRLSLSVTDLGRMSYANSVNYTAHISGSGVVNNAQITNGIYSYADIRNLAGSSSLRFDTTIAKGCVTLPIPTSVNASVDYQIDKGRPFYINALLTHQGLL